MIEPSRCVERKSTSNRSSSRGAAGPAVRASAFALSAANSDASAPVAVSAIGGSNDRRATVTVAVTAMHADRAAWADASRPMRTGRAGGGVGFRDLNREQTQNQHAGSGVFLICAFPRISMFRSAAQLHHRK
jgi:hypothetical protein